MPPKKKSKVIKYKSVSYKTFPRSSGIILHPTSLATPFGCGDLGPAAYNFIDFLQKSGQSFWQMLPIGPTGYRESPYQNTSAFAGNPILISPELLIQQNLLDIEWLNTRKSALDTELNGDPNKVKYESVIIFKNEMFDQAFTKFLNMAEDSDEKRRFNEFCSQEAYWLDEFALYYSLRLANGLHSWVEWPKEYALHNPIALEKWSQKQEKAITQVKFVQWLFQTQWFIMRDYAHNHGVQIIGDIPIFVAHDSADVWSHRELFTINDDGSLEYQAGVPPDYFSRTGQLWGNPLYRWEILREKQYQWFIERFQRAIAIMDWIRVDHFRGFEAYWRIGGREETAINGEWIKAPGKELFQMVLKKFGKIPLIAEDLGVITSEVEDLRDSFAFPGMRVLQFAFGGDETNPHLPHNYVHNCLVYTGTHDNDTTVGWWEKANEREKHFLMQYSGISNPQMPEDLIKMAYRSVANLAMIPMQDVLKQDSTARMNTPSIPEGNWQYRLPFNWYNDEIIHWLWNLTKIYRRIKS